MPCLSIVLIFGSSHADNTSFPAYTHCLHRIFYMRTDFAEEWPWCCWVRDECPIDLINGCDAGNPSKSLLIKRTSLLIKLQEHLIRIQTKMCCVNTYNTYQESLHSCTYEQWTVECCIMRNYYKPDTSLHLPPKKYGERRDGRKTENEKDREIQYVVKGL